jgi:hypothetical protein
VSGVGCAYKSMDRAALAATRSGRVPRVLRGGCYFHSSSLPVSLSQTRIRTFIR